jgi:hypothetical protein
MIDRKLTQQLQQWLEAKAEDRDIATGAMLLRRLVRNLTFAANFERNPKRHMKMAEYQLSKYLPMRLAEITHEDMVVMTKQVADIAVERKLDQPARKKQAGKRPDHDQLPEEIQACYAENLSIMQNMRACHAQLVLLSTQEKQSVCPDGDRYPFVKEIIALDEKYRQNWQRYDEYPAQE